MILESQPNVTAKIFFIEYLKRRTKTSFKSHMTEENPLIKGVIDEAYEYIDTAMAKGQ